MHTEPRAARFFLLASRSPRPGDRCRYPAKGIETAMPERIELTLSEQALMDRIIAVPAGREERVNIPIFFGVSIASLVLLAVVAAYSPKHLTSFVIVPLITGLMAFTRLQIAKLFRLIRFQNQLIHQACDPNQGTG